MQVPSSFPCIPASEKCWCRKFCTNFQTGLWYSPQNAIFTWDKKAYRSEKVYSAEIKCLCRVVFSCIWQTLKCTKNSRIHICYDSFILLLLWKLEATLQMCNGLKAKWHWSGLCSRYAKMYVLKLRFFFFFKSYFYTCDKTTTIPQFTYLLSIAAQNFIRFILFKCHI